MIKDVKNLVSIELESQWINKLYGKMVTWGQAIVFLIHMHQYSFLIENGASDGKRVCSGEQSLSLE